MLCVVFINITDINFATWTDCYPCRAVEDTEPIELPVVDPVLAHAPKILEISCEGNEF